MNRTVRIVLIILVAITAVVLLVRFWDDVERFLSRIGRKLKKVPGYTEEYNYDFDGVTD